MWSYVIDGLLATIASYSFYKTYDILLKTVELVRANAIDLVKLDLKIEQLKKEDTIKSYNPQEPMGSNNFLTVKSVKKIMKNKISKDYLNCDKREMYDLKRNSIESLIDPFFVYFVIMRKLKSTKASNNLINEFRESPCDFLENHRLEEWETDDEELQKIYLSWIEDCDSFLDELFIVQV